MPPGGFRPLWMRNLARGHMRFWEDEAPQEANGSFMSENPLHQTLSMDPVQTYEYQQNVFPPATKYDSA